MASAARSHREGTWLVREAMDRALADALDGIAGEGLPSPDPVLLDVGGRGRPYEALAAARLGLRGYRPRHLAVDAAPGGGVDAAATAEALPVRDGAAGLVLCTQMLEHVPDPQAAVGEMARVLAPGGACLLTTHGTWFYHPDPQDYWRWTSAGLRLLFQRAGFARVEVRPVGGTKLAVAALALTALERAEGNTLLAELGRAVVGPANAVAGRLLLGKVTGRGSVPGELVLNYVVTARKPALSSPSLE
ncbi:MAG TPA: class I SAM-dependent methyltransferase [Candidatus Polarisedimenticolia bacterium]|nr:class I SAM-dependent methyltransferase [Candidatus Polarisedimenticolia bacterium]